MKFFTDKISHFFKRIIKNNFFILIFPIFIGSFFGSYYLPEYISNRDAEDKILQIDEYNLGVACLIKKTITNNTDADIPLLYYDANIYKDNLDFINSRHRTLQISVLQNILYMESSNRMMEIGLLFSDRAEFRNKLLKNAETIQDNIKKYDARVRETKCE